ncbi:hypothetical protein Adt_02432 [Abeliophyllum distichum]|uniref:Kinetochore protein Spc24 n=1 Tax=Abeliophyllum distichum TaxID=126358 RepID=A0ABD1VVM2_9LAMI
MGETSRNVDMEELMTYSNNLVQILKSDKDINAAKQFLHKSKALQSQCDKDFYQVQKSIQEYEKKIDACKQKAAAAKSEAAADEELDLLQKELEDEQKEEHMLKNDEIDDLERQRDSIEERRKNLKKLEQDELRAQMKLSMFASVTNIIPNLDDPSKISGHIVDRDKKVIENFEFDPTKLTAFDTCDSIWKMINLR